MTTTVSRDNSVTGFFSLFPEKKRKKTGGLRNADYIKTTQTRKDASIMKIYIFVDIEGISGVSSRKYISMDEGRPDLVALARKYMAEDTNACIEGCFRGGASEVIVRDGHGGSSNMTREQADA